MKKRFGPLVAMTAPRGPVLQSGIAEGTDMKVLGRSLHFGELPKHERDVLIRERIQGLINERKRKQQIIRKAQEGRT